MVKCALSAALKPIDVRDLEPKVKAMPREAIFECFKMFKCFEFLKCFMCSTGLKCFKMLDNVEHF